VENAGGLGETLVGIKGAEPLKRREFSKGWWYVINFGFQRGDPFSKCVIVTLF
jgi:hypothetical protein